MGQPRRLFVNFCSFQQPFYRKIVDFNGIRTRFAVVDSEYSDHHQGPRKQLLIANKCML